MVSIATCDASDILSHRRRAECRPTLAPNDCCHSQRIGDRHADSESTPAIVVRSHEDTIAGNPPSVDRDFWEMGRSGRAAHEEYPLDDEKQQADTADR